MLQRCATHVDVSEGLALDDGRRQLLNMVPGKTQRLEFLQEHYLRVELCEIVLVQNELLKVALDAWLLEEGGRYAFDAIIHQIELPKFG